MLLRISEIILGGLKKSHVHYLKIWYPVGLVQGLFLLHFCRNSVGFRTQ